jgi:hypothetical protein
MFKRNKIKPTLPDNILQEYYALFTKCAKSWLTK